MAFDFTVRKDDTASPITATLTDEDGNAIDIQGASVRFKMFTERGVTKVDALATNSQVGNGSDGSKGKVTYGWAAGDTDTAGTYLAEWKVTFSNSKVQSFPNEDFLTIAVTSEPAGLNANALTTVSALEAFLDEPIAAGDPRRFAERLINGYSDAIQRYTKREFMPKTPTADSDQPVARGFDYDGSGFLSLAPYDLRSLGGNGFGGTGGITMFTDQPSAYQRALADVTSTLEGEYRLEPAGKSEEGTYLWLTVPVIDRVYPRTRRLSDTMPWTRIHSQFGDRVTVSGYWGVGDVPEDVELACLMACEMEWRREARRASGGTPLSDEEPDLTPDRGAFWLPFEPRSLLFRFMEARPKLLFV